MSNNTLEYRLLDDLDTYTVGLIPENRMITKDFLNVHKIQSNPRIEFKNTDGNVFSMPLVQIKTDYFATGVISGSSIGVKVSPLKNDKNKVSLYIKKTNKESF